MSTKTFKRWVERKNYDICFAIIQEYNIRKELGQKVMLFRVAFLILFIKRLFFVLLNLSRFRQIDFRSYVHSKTPKQFFKRLLGFYKFQCKNLLPESPELVPLNFEVHPAPLVSIIIAVHSHLDYTYNCLLSIIHHTNDIPYEIILVNDKSTDSTAAFISRCNNIIYVENDENIGFLKSCNKAASLAKGEYLCFLNNDTEVTPSWLNHMIEVFKQDHLTGLVGAKLIYPYGLLQEAGGLVNHFGEPANFGRFQNPQFHIYNSLRECDYCSGACIVVKQQDFKALDGFDIQFSPAFYEDTDLAFSIRYLLNKKVYFQPLSEIIHFEGISTGKVSNRGNVKQSQYTNSYKFRKKWENVLQGFPKYLTHNQLASRFDVNKKSILFIDEFIPEPDTNSGSRRIYELIKIFKSQGYHVLFLANDGKKKDPYFSNIVQIGVQVLYPQFEWQKAVPELKSIVSDLSIAWISRPELNEFYAPYIKANPLLTWVYDTVDLHFIREERRLSVLKHVSDQLLDEIQAIKNQEIQLAKEADITIAITHDEAAVLKKEGAKNVAIIPNVHIPHPDTLIDLNKRKGIIFIGGYYHQPNVDAVLWLVQEIMPIVWSKFPNIQVTLLGSNPTTEMIGLNSERVKVTGYVEDVTEYFLSARLFIAPLRYGAGMKGKVGQSLEYGLPVITTTIGAEGMMLTHEHDVLIGDTKEMLANAIIRLYNDDELWMSMSLNSKAAIQQYSPEKISQQLLGIFNNQTS